MCWGVMCYVVGAFCVRVSCVGVLGVNEKRVSRPLAAACCWV